LERAYSRILPRLVLFWGGIGCILIPASAQTGMFVPGITYTPPLRPLYVLTGDFNGDNIQDFIVVSDEGTGEPANAYVLLGNGDGTFKPATSYPLGIAGFSAPGVPSQGILIINNNGSPVEDLIVPIAVSNTVNVLLGKGDGSFGPLTTYAVDNHPAAAVVAETDGTAYPELAVVADGITANGSSVSILLGHGDGTFAPATIIPLAAPSPTSITSGYFRHNVFDTDLAIGTSTGIAVLLGKGHGTFQPEVDYPFSSAVTSIAVDDFNEDTFPDLAATHGNTVSILLGNGDGTFQAPKDYAVGNGARAIFVARALLNSDLNQDHHDDIVVANYDDNTSSVLLGYGDGTFQPALTFPVNGIRPNSIVIANFNGDNAPDLVVSTESGSTPGSLGSATVFLNSRGTSGTLSCSPTLIQFGQNTTCAAKFTPKLSDTPIPSGNVVINFQQALPPLCSGALDATGKMQCKGGNFLGIGGWGIHATYSGDKNYNPGAFGSTVLTVDDLGFSAISPVSATIAAGQTAQFEVELQAMGGQFNSILTCMGAPRDATCSLPANVKTPAQINVMVQTTSRTTAAFSGMQGSTWPWTIAIGGVLILPGISGRKRPRRQLARTLPLWFLLFLASCGGGSSGSTSNPNGTPAGTYTITLHAAAAGLTTSITFTLNVQ
jgi:FG-GAP-like repeat